MVQRPAMLNTLTGWMKARTLMFHVFFCFSPGQFLTSTTRRIDDVSNPAAFSATHRALRPEGATTTEPPPRPAAPLLGAGRPCSSVDINGHHQRRQCDPETHTALCRRPCSKRRHDP